MHRRFSQLIAGVNFFFLFGSVVFSTMGTLDAFIYSIQRASSRVDEGRSRVLLRHGGGPIVVGPCTKKEDPKRTSDAFVEQ